MLATNDALFAKGNRWVPVKALEGVRSRAEVYLIKLVSPLHTFFADGILAHNKAKTGS